MRKPVSVRRRAIRGSAVRGRLAVSLAAAVAVLAVTGCGAQSAEPEPLDQDEKSQADQPDQSKSTDKSDNQDQGDNEDKVIRGDDDEGKTDDQTAAEAEGLIADYLDAENVAIKDGDFSGVEPFIEECRVCTASRESIEEVYESGGKIEGSLFTKPNVSAGRQAPNGTVTVTVVSTISAYKVYDKAGAVVDSEPAKEQTFQYGVAERDGKWKIVSGEFVI